VTETAAKRAVLLWLSELVWHDDSDPSLTCGAVTEQDENRVLNAKKVLAQEFARRAGGPAFATHPQDPKEEE
jgi:hypothetical protein